mmetsp:Transcript_18022/g.72125  ORF Transcript_18022/g.72125 Transcript_18022/m.72125 type:complete len:233 (+) Transcript_18022:917-1615(+)
MHSTIQRYELANWVVGGIQSAVECIPFSEPTEENWYPVMNGCWDKLQDWVKPCKRLSPTVSNQERYWRCLVQQLDLPHGVVFVLWIHIDATIHNRPMYISNKGSHIAQLALLPIKRGLRLESLQHLPSSLIIENRPAFVYGVLMSCVGYLDILVSENKFIERWIQGESVQAISNTEHQGGRRSIQCVASGNELFSRLNHVIHSRRPPRKLPEDPKNRTLFAWYCRQERWRTR